MLKSVVENVDKNVWTDWEFRQSSKLYQMERVEIKYLLGKMKN